MAKPLSRLKSLAIQKGLRYYEELYFYTHRYCGSKLMSAVEEHEEELRRFFEEIGEPVNENEESLKIERLFGEKVYIYRKPKHYMKPRLTCKR